VTERWRPVPGYEGLYEVSDRGQVRSLDRQVIAQMPTGPAVQRYPGKVLRNTIRPDGYAQVGLSRAGVQKTFNVHILVLEAFVGPCPPGQEARHGPGGKSDPSLANLRGWGTRKENFADRIEDGQGNRGERHGLAKLTTAVVLEIRARVAAGERQADVARDLGVGPGNVWVIIHRKNWQHI
jgi:NUMOD4 motif